MNDTEPKPDKKAAISHELHDKLSKFAPAYQIRLTSLYSKWLEGKAKRDDIVELEKAGLIAKESDDEAGDLIAGGDEGAANYIRQTFGVPCTKMTISRWRKGTSLPKGCSEPFPQTPVSGLHSRSRVKAWAESYLSVRKTAGGQRVLTAVERKQEADARVAELEAIRIEREQSGKWIQMDFAKSYVAGIGARMALHYDKLIEDKDGIRKIVAAAIQSTAAANPDLLARVDSILETELPKANDAIKGEFRLAAEEAVKSLKESRREQLKNDERTENG